MDKRDKRESCMTLDDIIDCLSSSEDDEKFIDVDVDTHSQTETQDITNVKNCNSKKPKSRKKLSIEDYFRMHSKNNSNGNESASHKMSNKLNNGKRTTKKKSKSIENSSKPAFLEEEIDKIIKEENNVESVGIATTVSAETTVAKTSVMTTSKMPPPPSYYNSNSNKPIPHHHNSPQKKANDLNIVDMSNNKLEDVGIESVANSECEMEIDEVIKDKFEMKAENSDSESDLSDIIIQPPPQVESNNKVNNLISCLDSWDFSDSGKDEDSNVSSHEYDDDEYDSDDDDKEEEEINNCDERMMNESTSSELEDNPNTKHTELDEGIKPFLPNFHKLTEVEQLLCPIPGMPQTFSNDLLQTFLVEKSNNIRKEPKQYEYKFRTEEEIAEVINKLTKMNKTMNDEAHLPYKENPSDSNSNKTEQGIGENVEAETSTKANEIFTQLTKDRKQQVRIQKQEERRRKQDERRQKQEDARNARLKANSQSSSSSSQSNNQTSMNNNTKSSNNNNNNNKSGKKKLTLMLPTSNSNVKGGTSKQQQQQTTFNPGLLPSYIDSPVNNNIGENRNLKDDEQTLITENQLNKSELEAYREMEAFIEFGDTEAIEEVKKLKIERAKRVPMKIIKFHLGGEVESLLDGKVYPNYELYKNAKMEFLTKKLNGDELHAEQIFKKFYSQDLSQLDDLRVRKPFVFEIHDDGHVEIIKNLATHTDIQNGMYEPDLPRVAEDSANVYDRATVSVINIRERCMSCFCHLPYSQTEGIRLHDDLKTLMCNNCHKFWSSSPFELLEGAVNEIHCRCCGGQWDDHMILCDFCSFSFCSTCLIRLLGDQGMIDMIMPKSHFMCPICCPTYTRIRLLRSIAQLHPAIEQQNTKKWDNWGLSKRRDAFIKGFTSEQLVKVAKIMKKWKINAHGVHALARQMPNVETSEDLLAYAMERSKRQIYQKQQIHSKLIAELDECLGQGVFRKTVRNASRIYDDIAMGKEPVTIPVYNEVDDAVFPKNFVYVNKMVFHSTYSGSSGSMGGIGCTCSGKCLDPTECSCAQLTGGFFGMKTEGILRAQEPKSLIKECGILCSCGADCPNRQTQKGIHLKGLQVFRTPWKGWGLRTAQPIAAGEYICDYVGEKINEFQADLIGSETGDQYFFNITAHSMKHFSNNEKFPDSEPLLKLAHLNGGRAKASKHSAFHKFIWTQHFNQTPNVQEAGRLYREAERNMNRMVADSSSQIESFIPASFVVDSKFFGNIGRFMNHSCEPNVRLFHVFSHGMDPSFYRLAFFAVKNLPPGTELVYNYGYQTCKPGEEYKIKCQCGAKNCGKYLR